jgi:hypothetical protein
VIGTHCFPICQIGSIEVRCVTAGRPKYFTICPKVNADQALHPTWCLHRLKVGPFNAMPRAAVQMPASAMSTAFARSATLRCARFMIA